VLHEFGLECKIEGNSAGGAKIVEQTPKPGASIPKKSIVILYTYKPDRTATVKVPDVLNETVSEATRTLNDAGLNIKVNGIGTAVKQSIAPGTSAAKGDVIVVEFRNLETE